MHGGANLLRAFLIALVAVALPACHADEDTQAVSSSTQVSGRPTRRPPRRIPLPRLPTRRRPRRTRPRTAALRPGSRTARSRPGAAGGPTFPLPGTGPRRSPSAPVAAACADVLDALTDAVIRYEVAALAEGAGSGSRSAAAAEMLAAIERARAAASSQAGVPSAAAPAINAVDRSAAADSTAGRRWTSRTPHRGADRVTTSRPGAGATADGAGRGRSPPPVGSLGPVQLPPARTHQTGSARGCGAAGSAPHWQCGGQGFESPQLHPSEQGFLRRCALSTISVVAVLVAVCLPLPVSSRAPIRSAASRARAGMTWL